MPLFTDFQLPKLADGTVVVPLSPPTDVTGWEVRWTLARRPESSNPIVQKYTVSGGGNASGVSVRDFSAGIFAVEHRAVDTSGQAGNLFCTLERLGSGVRTPLAQGYLILTDSGTDT